MDSITIDGIPLQEYLDKQQGREIRILRDESMREMYSCRGTRFSKSKIPSSVPKSSPVYSYTEKEKRRYVIMNTKIEVQNQRKTNSNKTVLLIHVLRNWKEIRQDLIDINHFSDSDIPIDPTCNYITHYLNERYSESLVPYARKDLSATITNLMKKLIPLKLARYYTIGIGNERAYQISEDFLNMPMRQLLHVLNVKQKEGDPNILNIPVPELAKLIQEDEEKPQLDSYLKVEEKKVQRKKQIKTEHQFTKDSSSRLEFPANTPDASRELFLTILDKYNELFRVREIVLDKEGTLRVIF